MRDGYPTSAWEPVILSVGMGAALWLASGRDLLPAALGAVSGTLVFLMRHIDRERAAYRALEDRLKRLETDRSQ